MMLALTETGPTLNKHSEVHVPIWQRGVTGLRKVIDLTLEQETALVENG